MSFLKPEFFNSSYRETKAQGYHPEWFRDTRFFEEEIVPPILTKKIEEMSEIEEIWSQSRFSIENFGLKKGRNSIVIWNLFNPFSHLVDRVIRGINLAV